MYAASTHLNLARVGASVHFITALQHVYSGQPATLTALTHPLRVRFLSRAAQQNADRLEFRLDSSLQPAHHHFPRVIFPIDIARRKSATAADLAFCITEQHYPGQAFVYISNSKGSSRPARTMLSVEVNIVRSILEGVFGRSSQVHA